MRKHQPITRCLQRNRAR